VRHSNIASAIGGICLVHIEEMRHCGPHVRHAEVIKRHLDLAVEDLQQRAVPQFDDVVMCGKALIDEVAQILTNQLASMPIGNAGLQTAFSAKQSKRSPKGLSSSPLRGAQLIMRRPFSAERSSFRTSQGH
jgi:hypothetical protein